jgi:hypothetical protein
MPDDAVMVDYMLEHAWIVGDLSECANRLDQVYDEVSGFGYVLTTTHDPAHHGLEQTSLRLLEDDDLSGVTAHATARKRPLRPDVCGAGLALARAWRTSSGKVSAT